ncbi:hypothetical protein, partial [Fulvivirga sp.]|uniref:hypothetical protein n=1 Tax=Fulvivirga sp. TaxID=1931237 RepID=UPI0032EE6C31
MTNDWLRKTTPIPKPHLPTHNQSFGIRVVKIRAGAAQCITKYIKHAGTVDDNLLFWCAGTFYIQTL